MCDVIFYETKGINEEIMVSKLDFRSKYILLNKKTSDGKWKNYSIGVRKSNSGWRRCESFIIFFY